MACIAILTPNILYTDALHFYMEGCLYLGCFYARVLLHGDAFFEDRFSFNEQTFTHKDAFAQRFFDTHTTFTHRCCSTGMLLYRGASPTDTHVLLHTDAFTQRCFYTGMFLNTCALYARVLLTQGILETQKLLSTNTPTKRCPYTEIHSYRGVFFYTQILLQRHVFARILLHRDAFAHRCF